MACDTCGKMKGGLEPLSDNMRRYLPFKYHNVEVCDDCRRKLDDELDKQRQLAWQRTALLLVDMVSSGQRQCRDCAKFKKCLYVGKVSATVCCEFKFSFLMWIAKRLYA